MHNGAIRHFSTIKRDLLYRVDPKMFACIEGTTDSEAFFFLALTFGLEEDPPAAVAKAVGYITKIGRENGIDHPVQMTVAVTDGKGLWAFRYSSEGNSRTLYYSTDKQTLKDMYPNDSRFDMFDDESRFIVSEPLGNVPGVWNKVPESSCVTVNGKSIEVTPFEPIMED
jgi:glutamine amidotransferase